MLLLLILPALRWAKSEKENLCEYLEQVHYRLDALTISATSLLSYVTIELQQCQMYYDHLTDIT